MIPFTPVFFFHFLIPQSRFNFWAISCGGMVLGAGTSYDSCLNRRVCDCVRFELRFCTTLSIALDSFQMEMLRKFMMVGVLVFIFPGEPAQLGVGLLIVFVFLVLQLILQPCATRDLNHMQSVSLITLMLTLLVGLMRVIDKYISKELDFMASGPWGMLYASGSSLGSLNRKVFTFIGVSVNAFTMCAPAFLIARRLYNEMGSFGAMIQKGKTFVSNDHVNIFHMGHASLRAPLPRPPAS
jgi:hypothetical protein